MRYLQLVYIVFQSGGEETLIGEVVEEPGAVRRGRWGRGNRGEGTGKAEGASGEGRGRGGPAGEQQLENLYSAVGVGAYSVEVGVQHRLPCISQPAPGR